MGKLCFCSAAFGSWGIVRLGTLVPECHMLFVCPYSCGRHNSIGAIKHGYKDKISYLFVDERDLALGTMTQDIPKAIERITTTLSQTPKVILIYFSCVLYMSGLDWNSIIEELSEAFPNIVFRACMMNPIAGNTKSPPVPAMIDTLCSLWDFDGSQKDTVNLLGCYETLDSKNELFRVLSECGCGKLLHFTDAKCFEDYQTMGSSKYNIVVRPEGLLAAMKMKKRIPYSFVPVSYDINQVSEQYENIFSTIGCRTDLREFQMDAENSIKEVRLLIGDSPIAVGSSAVCRPFDLARALIRYGFNVSDVFYETCPEFEQTAKVELERMSNVKFHNVHDPECAERIGKCSNAQIAIGYSAGYYTGAKYVADIMIDEGMFGYGGITRLMALLKQAIREPIAVEAMIEEYGLIV